MASAENSGVCIFFVLPGPDYMHEVCARVDFQVGPALFCRIAPDSGEQRHFEVIPLPHTRHV